MSDENQSGSAPAVDTPPAGPSQDDVVAQVAAEAKAAEEKKAADEKEAQEKAAAAVEAQKKAEAEEKAEQDRLKAEAEAKAAQEKAAEDAKAAAEQKAADDLAALNGRKLYVVTKGFPYFDPDQGVKFIPGERTPALMTNWLQAQIDAGYIEEYVAPAE